MTATGSAHPAGVAALWRRARNQSPSVGDRYRAADTGFREAEALLTPREIEVLALVGEGLTNREIAARLFISDKTASVHVSRILAKLSVPNRAAAAVTAQRLGLNDTR